jgi:hypothetical protein
MPTPIDERPVIVSQLGNNGMTDVKQRRYSDE